MTDEGQRRPTRPPRLLRTLARLLVRGRDAGYIVADLDDSYTRDMERGVGRAVATRRYAANVVASAWSVRTTTLRALVTSGIGLDVRLGIRMLARQRLVTMVAGLTLGLGIPASLTLVHGIDVLYGDFPVPDGERLVGLRHYDLAGQRPLASTPDDYESWTGLTSLESIGAARSYRVNVTADEAAGPPVLAAEITASSFDLLRARPLLGRTLDASDEDDGAPDVVVIGEELWRTRFEGDPGVLGRSLRIGRASHTVIGVMPADFGFPLANQLWLPYRARARDFAPGEGPRANVYGRLADDATVEAARTELAGLTARRAAADPERFERLTSEVVTMPILLLNMRPGIWTQPDLLVMQVLIFGLLMVVCGNVGTLILARTAARSSEITIRTALGASRGRILTQLFVEALVLSTVATGLGLLAANAFATRLGRLFGAFDEDFSYWWVDFTLTPRIVAIAFGLAALCAVVAGVLPALSTTRRAIQANLQRSAQRGGSGRFGLGSSFLIVSEIVLSVGFLSLGATAVRSAFVRHDDELGFDPDRYVVATFTVPDLDPLDAPTALDSVAWAQRVAESQRALLVRLAEDPGVVRVGMGQDLPGMRARNRDVILETPLVDVEPVEWDTWVPRVDVAFFGGLDRPILAGRDFGAGDVAGPPGEPHTSVLVNASFVRDVLGGRNAIGQRFRYEAQGWGDLPEGAWYEIVGVVGSFGTNVQNPERDAAVYHPLAPGEANPVRYAVEVSDDPDAFISRFRRIAASVDPEATVEPNLLSASIRTESLIIRAMFLAMLGLAGATFLLSATGLYALMSFTVSRRTREIGIRAALGAGTADIVSAVARRAVVQIGVGLTLGIGFGWAILRQFDSGLDLDPGNIPLTLALVAAVAGGVCALACAYPTVRGLRIQPTEALRET